MSQVKHLYLQHALLPKPPSHIDENNPSQFITFPEHSQRPVQMFHSYLSEQHDSSHIEYCHWEIMHNKDVADLNLWTILVDAETQEIYHARPNDKSTTILVVHNYLPLFDCVKELPDIKWKSDQELRDTIPEVDWDSIPDQMTDKPSLNAATCEVAVRQHIRKHNTIPPIYHQVTPSQRSIWKHPGYDNLFYESRHADYRAKVNLPYPVLRFTFIETEIIGGTGIKENGRYKVINGERQATTIKQSIGILYQSTEEKVKECQDNESTIPYRATP